MALSSSPVIFASPLQDCSANQCVIATLKSCSSLSQFAPLHAQLITTNLIHEPLIGVHVLKFLISAKCLNSHYQSLLKPVYVRETELWNALIGSHARNGLLNDAFEAYYNMVDQGVTLDVTTFHILIHVCCDAFDAAPGSEIHGRIVKSGLQYHRSLRNNLMRMYTKFGKLESVRQLFDEFPGKDVVSWNSMVSCYLKMGLPRQALDLFGLMVDENVAADEITMVSLVSACAKLKDLGMAERLRLYIDKNGLDISGSLLNCLVDMYVKCGSLEKARVLVGKEEMDVVSVTSLIRGYLESGDFVEARCLFDGVKDKSLITWTTMMAGYARGGYFYECLELFKLMRCDMVEVDEIVLVIALSACADVVEFNLGKSIHGLVVKCGMTVDGVLGNALLDLYSKGGGLDEVQAIFEELPDKSIVSWNTMLAALCRNDIGGARTFFTSMPLRDVVSWNTLINYLGKLKQFEQVFAIFGYMQNSESKPDKLTLVNLLSSCASAGSLSHGIWVHAYMLRIKIKLDNMLATALVDMYGKCGSIEKASDTFFEIKEPNVFLWTAIIAANAMEGRGKEAIELFLQMEERGIKPDGRTFIALLCACSHGGLVEEGYKHFNRMVNFYKIVPTVQHYGCMVDLLARAGRLEEATKFIGDMLVEPDVSIWTSLLKGCESNQNLEFAEHAFRHLIELDPLNDSAHMILSNIYTKVGKWDDASRVRMKMKDMGVKKQPGCSSIEINGQLTEFITGDHSNPQAEDICFILNEIDRLHKGQGQGASASHHSEKLAVAYGLINTARGTPIRITNNLRMCGVCHSIMKLVSQLYDREIVIRDNYRFHRFQTGLCSCKEFW